MRHAQLALLASPFTAQHTTRSSFISLSLSLSLSLAVCVHAISSSWPLTQQRYFVLQVKSSTTVSILLQVTAAITNCLQLTTDRQTDTDTQVPVPAGRRCLTGN